MNAPLILVEGWADRLLLLALRFRDKDIINQKGKSNIPGAMQQQYLNDKVVAMIDEDKLTKSNQSPYFNEFRSEQKLDDLERKRHPTNRWHLLIVLRPKAIETWSINGAERVGITLADYGLPNDAKKLGQRLKNRTIDHDENVRKFFKALDHKNPPQIQTLKTWLQEIQAL